MTALTEAPVTTRSTTSTATDGRARTIALLSLFLASTMELLDTTIKRHGADRPCVLSPSGNWTYGELLAVASQVARVLTEDFGIVPGNRVLLRGPNNPWLAACWRLAGRQRRPSCRCWS